MRTWISFMQSCSQLSIHIANPVSQLYNDHSRRIRDAIGGAAAGNPMARWANDELAGDLCRYHDAGLAQRANPGDARVAARLQLAVSDLDTSCARWGVNSAGGLFRVFEHG
jgi:hypothetical protein